MMEDPIWRQKRTFMITFAKELVESIGEQK